jgi:phage FluMu protein gp41
MATVKITLDKGLEIGGRRHTEAEIKEASLGDVIEGATEGERLVKTPEGEWVLAASKALVAIHILRRQIVRIGGFEGPFTLDVIEKLSAKDLALLQAAADRLENVVLGVAIAGESGSPSGGA